MRITGGVYRSRALVAPRGQATRPTSDRVREALFSILAAEVTLAGASVLDLYAGTGALAFEALSRGAGRALLVDSSRDAVRAIRDNAAALGVEERAVVVPLAVEHAALAVTAGAPFDVVFADPPYDDVASDKVAKAMDALLASPAPLLAPGGRLVLEHGKRDAAPSLVGLILLETRAYGDTRVSLYGAAADPPLLFRQR